MTVPLLVFGTWRMQSLSAVYPLVEMNPYDFIYSLLYMELTLIKECRIKVYT